MRPSLSLAVLPVLSALVALPVSAASHASPSSAVDVEVEAPPPSLPLSQRFPPSLSLAGAAVETVKRVAKRLRPSGRRGRSEEEVFFHWVDSEQNVEVAEGTEEGLDEEEERRREEEEEREMWRGLLGGLNGKEGGEVSEMFRELVAGGPGGGGGGQVVFSAPDLPLSSFSSSSSSSSPSPASLSSNPETESPHVAPPPSLLPPPTIPDKAEYHVPPHSHHEAETFRSLQRKVRLLAGATVEGLAALIRPIPFSLPLHLSPNNRTISSLSTLPRPSLSLVAHPLETLKTRLPPSLGLTFVVPGGAGGMSK